VLIATIEDHLLAPDEKYQLREIPGRPFVKRKAKGKIFQSEG
jgi:hypothetical protein